LRKLTFTQWLFVGFLVLLDVRLYTMGDTPQIFVKPPFPTQVARVANGTGMLCPISANQAITAAHMFGGVDPDARTILSPARFWKVSSLDEKADWALLDLEMGPEIRNFPKVAKELPNSGDQVSYLVYYSNRLMVGGLIFSRFVGKDPDGDLVFDGNGQFGMSGGCVLNSSGELIGIMKALQSLDNRANPFPIATNLVGRVF
jgi:hypothetical protein